MNIRRRLTVLYALVWAAMHLMFTMAVYLFFSFHLGVEVDEFLASWAGRIQESEAGRAFLIPNAADRVAAEVANQYSMSDTFVFVFDDQGRLLFNQSLFSEADIDLLRRFSRESVRVDGGMYRRILVEQERYRLLEIRVAGGSPASAYTLFVGRSLTHMDRTLERLTVSLVLAWIIAALLFSMVLWMFVGNTLRPIRDMTVHAMQIAGSGDLGRRIADNGAKDEFNELASALNRMLASMELSHESQKQFLADASHELRTPLTSIKANLEFLRRVTIESRDNNATALDDSISEADRMAILVNDLLLLARAEANCPRTSERTDLGAVVVEAAEGFHNRTKRQIREFRVELSPSPAYALGDQKVLKQAVVALLDNAFKYTSVGGSIVLRLANLADEVTVSVEDDGPGIPPLELGAVFRRFYRATNIHEKVPGTGLGLSIAQSIIRNHGGSIELANRHPHGLSAILRLPASR